MNLAVHTTDLLIASDLVPSLTSLGHKVESFAVVQDLCSALYRSPETVGIIASSSATFAAMTVQGFRAADVKNCLFVLIEQRRASSAAAVAERVASLTAGADDAQPLVIDVAEINARLTALTRRGNYNDHQLVKLPGCQFDAINGFVERLDGGKHIKLSPIESRLFVELARQPGITLSKSVLMDRLYGGADNEPEPKIIDVLICKIRQKIRPALAGGVDVIETVWGRGFRLDPDGFVPRFRDNVRVPR